ncbi:MAG: LacI family DNA-binding transcriptional regulator, partial [Lacisediminihabitans sp.]
MDVPKRRAPNIRDVARAAGVSYQTVSRALNDSPAIRESTRTKVLAAIGELGYRPNSAARALATSRSKTIGVLSSQSGLYGPTTSIQTIEAAARLGGYRLSVTNITTGDYESMRAGLDFLLDQSIDALVVLAPQDGIYKALRELSIGVPYVTLEATGLDPQRSVSIDQTHGGRLATRHLIGLGHEQIAYISGPSDWIEAQARYVGYREEMLQAGLQPRECLFGDWTAATGHQIGMNLLKDRDFTAIFCGNDQTALGFLHACRDVGVSVPGDISVVGFDDIPEAAHFAPALTTVRQNFVEIGRRAIALLLSELAGTDKLSHEPIAPELV